MRANIGCGSIRPGGWENFDNTSASEDVGVRYWDVRFPNIRYEGVFDYAVCSFMLQELTFHELPEALENLRATLKPGGTLRILVPNIDEAIDALRRGDEGWFPQDERSGDIDGKFCTYVTWYGTSKSVFTDHYMEWLLDRGEWSTMNQTSYRRTTSEYPEIVNLDSRPKEALIYEVTR